MNESKILKQHISCEYKCKFDGRKCNSDQWWNNYKYRVECKKHNECERDYIWNPTTCACKNGKYLTSTIDNSGITCNKIIKSYDEETKTVATNFNKKYATCK